MNSFKTSKGTELPLIDLKGKPYLQVQQRIIWFREERPDWTIDTHVTHMGTDFAVVECSILDEKGRLISRDRKKEDSKGFGDFVEKATTGSIGRALALCGFGTQFAVDLDEGERIVDAPSTVRSYPSMQTAAPISLHMPSGGWGKTVVPFGKNKGKTLDQVGVDEAESFVVWLHKTNASKGEPLSAMAQGFVESVAHYREEISGKFGKMRSDIQAQFEDDVPL